MNILRITTIALFILPGFTSQSMAAGCSLSNKAKPNMSFASSAQAPRDWKIGKLPPKIARSLANVGTKKSRDTTDANDPLDHVDIICDDWIAICSNDDCTHGVLECDGDCLPF